jgi:hypothetical protein
VWIDLFDSPTGTMLSVDEAVKALRAGYDAASEAENASREGWLTGIGKPFDFRKAVVLVGQDGCPLRCDVEEQRAVAHSLLYEYGMARGGIPVGVYEETRDFARWRSFAMEFMGGPTEPEMETRLKGAPSIGNVQLEGLEERYVVFAGKAGA